MARLPGKVAIVSGGARGMGAATARLFAAEGAQVAIADLLQTEGEALAAELGTAASYHRLDVSDEGAWQELASELRARHGGVDVLINNAGIISVAGILDMDKAEFERVLSVNLIGTFLGIKTIAPLMIERGAGAIVNISSVDGMKGSNGLCAYGSSKWGVRGLTKIAALELGHRGVRVNSIHPGGVDTQMGVAPGPDGRSIAEGFFAGIPLGRIGTPEEIAQTSLFLASDDASYLCGAEITVDGGMTAGSYLPAMPGGPPPAD